MTAWHPLLSASFLIQAILWPVGFLILYRIHLLQESSPRSGNHPWVSVIIPARNEAKRLPALLSSLSHQSVQPVEVIVVDDHSTDETAAIARRARCRVVKSEPLPPGWTGKNWACHQGAQAAQGDLYLFLDADITIQPKGLERIVDTYHEKGGVLSLQPYHETKKVYEELSAFFNLIQLIGSNAFTFLGQSFQGKKLFGPVLAVSKNDYLRSGGHEAVKDKVLENFFMARKFLGHHIPLFCFGGKGVVHFRMYPDGYRALLEGWTKSVASGARGTTPLILIGVVAWLTGCLGTARHLIVTAFSGSSEKFMGFAGLYLLYVVQIAWMLNRTGRFRLTTSFLYPIPLLFFALVFIRALILSCFPGRFTWKGRTLQP